MARGTWVGGPDGPLVRWLDQWKSKAIAEGELGAAEQTVRTAQQAKSAELVRSLDSFRQQEEGLKRQLAEVLSRYRLRWGLFAGVLASTYFSFALVVWALGVISELTGMWIVLAGNVGEIRAALARDPRG
jgi:hypothetical protein